MKKVLVAALAAATALTGAMSAGVASAQPYDQHARGGYDQRGHDQRGPDQHGPDQRGPEQHGHDQRGPGPGGRWRTYGGQYGYNGYHGRWRSGQRYTHWRDNRYVINDWRAYNLPPPRAGYRYYRDDNGDVVMAAVASGMIGLILGGALAH